MWSQTTHTHTQLNRKQDSCLLLPKKKRPSCTVLDRWYIPPLYTSLGTRVSIWSLPTGPLKLFSLGKVPLVSSMTPKGCAQDLREGPCSRLLSVDLLSQVGPWKASSCIPTAFTLMATPSSQRQCVCSSRHLTDLNLFLGLHQWLASSKLRTSISSCPLLSTAL